jgi:hypothetical protein
VLDQTVPQRDRVAERLHGNCSFTQAWDIIEIRHATEGEYDLVIFERMRMLVEPVSNDGLSSHKIDRPNFPCKELDVPQHLANRIFARSWVIGAYCSKPQNDFRYPGAFQIQTPIRNHFDCPLDNMFFDFVGITSEQFKEHVSTGAEDEEIAAWIVQHGQPRERIEIIKWNNDLRYKRLSELPDRIQEFMEDYIPQFVPAHLRHHIDYFFDIYDAEEKRMET